MAVVVKKIVIFLIDYFVLLLLLLSILMVYCYKMDLDPYTITGFMKIALFLLPYFGAKKVAAKFSKTKKNYSTVTPNHSK